MFGRARSGSRPYPPRGVVLSFTGILFILLVAALAAPGALAAPQPINTIYGEDLPLGGTAPGLDVIYLFLTGPNLPDQGISLVGGAPVATGVPGSFTRVEVNTDGTWSYTWRTSAVGRILDPGTYTLYIVEEPLARPDLDDTVYAIQAIVFGAPVETVTVTAPATTGSLVVDSSPGMSMVTLDGRSGGITPARISDIPPGPHTLIVSHAGYLDYRANVTISAGGETEITAILQPVAATPSIPVPTGTTPPGRLAPAVLVPLGAAALAILGFRRIK
jgi:PEGA domain